MLTNKLRMKKIKDYSVIRIIYTQRHIKYVKYNNLEKCHQYRKNVFFF